MPVTARPEDVGLSASRLGRVRDWMAGNLESGRLPGMLTLVARHGEIAFLECAGAMDIEAAKPFREDTICRFYSMSKPITSVAVMMLYEEGRFQLDDPICRYLPDFADMRVHVSGEGEAMVTAPACRDITLRHLLTHTAGMTYGFETTPVAALYRAQGVNFNPSTGSGTLTDAVARLARLPLLCHPGTAWNYGVSLDVLGRLVEVITDQSLDRFLEERIFQPLGMLDTGFQVPPDKLNRFAALYGPTLEGGIALKESPAQSAFAQKVALHSGGGGLMSTASDYFRFTEMLRLKGEFNGVRLLGRKTVDYMTRNHLPGDLADMGQASFSETSYEGIGFGLGFSVMLDPVKAQVMGTPGEYAWGGMASTAFWVDPGEDMTVIFLTQLSPSSTYPLRRQLRVLTYQALIG